MNRASYLPVSVALAASLGGVVIFYGPGAAALDWDRYLRCSSNLSDLTKKLIHQEEASGDQYLAETVRHHTQHATELLENVVARDPSNARAHLRLAGRYLQRFELETAESENRMPVEWIRDAAIKSRFGSREDLLAWLHRAYGEQAELLVKAHVHARQAVALCPLQGEGYLYLASLAFLEPTHDGVVPALVEQALRVRPYDGEVLFDAGRQLQLAGQTERALELWRECLQRPGTHRFKLVSMLASTIPASMFVQEMQPDRATIDLAIRQYQLRNSEDDLRALVQYAAVEARAATERAEEEPKRLAQRWRQVSALHRSLQVPRGGCLRRRGVEPGAL